MIVIHQENTYREAIADTFFVAQDNGDVFQQQLFSSQSIPFGADVFQGKIIESNHDIDTLIAQQLTPNSILVIVDNTAEGKGEVNGWANMDGVITKHEVVMVPVREKLFSRLEGLFETGVLNQKKVMIIGLGSGGSPIAIELAKAGVGYFILVDHDRLEIENIIRHVCGISDLGRYKTKAMRDLLLDKNPYAQIDTCEFKVTPDRIDQLKELVSKVDLVLCCTDNRESRLIINGVCVSENKVCIYGGTFQRAYGGQVLRVTPGKSMCYQCFTEIMPDVAADQEISSTEQANRLAYSDRIVPVEPGLSNDIAPISTMVVKLATLELLRDTSTTLSSLYDDLPKSWYMWLNRREINTEYENLEPMDDAQDSLRILAWYGVENEPNPGCPACGDFKLRLPESAPEITEEDIQAFLGDGQVSDIVPPPPGAHL